MAHSPSLPLQPDCGSPISPHPEISASRPMLLTFHVPTMVFPLLCPPSSFWAFIFSLRCHGLQEAVPNPNTRRGPPVFCISCHLASFVPSVLVSVPCCTTLAPCSICPALRSLQTSYRYMAILFTLVSPHAVTESSRTSQRSE